MKTISVIRFLFVSAALAAFSSFALANNAWLNYHWARTINPFTLQLGDNVNSAWDPYLQEASLDWTASAVLNTTVVAGKTTPRTCQPTSGRVEVCNAGYGKTGWLGIAQVWVIGDHITQGTVKLNDTYFKTSTYNKPGHRRLVMCQEIGHTFGLAHVDETFGNTNLGTCMDYTNNPLGPPSNEHPNLHDYSQLETIYAHLDSTTTVGQTVGSGSPAASDPRTRFTQRGTAQWGKLAHSANHGRTERYERDLDNGQKIVTHVIWAD